MSVDPGGGSDFELPPEFDAAYYRQYSDLAHMDDQHLARHFQKSGKSEGRCAAEASQKAEFLKLVPQNAPVLEIGPFDKPALRGEHVAYFDVLDKDGLAARAAALGHPPKDIPAIDYVEPNGNLDIVPDSHFTAAFSSHCIEHQIDLVDHLRSVERILRPNGRYFLIIPDKRYCFDHFIAESTIANAVSAHHARSTRHRLESIIENRALVTHNDCNRHWKGDHVNAGAYWETISSRTRNAIAEFAAADGYIDVHAWQFTPDSFRTLMAQLHEIDLCGLVVERVYSTLRGSNEFMAVLQKPQST